MKRTFVEPIIKRIELNLKENIAYSGYDPNDVTYMRFALANTAGNDCIVIESGAPFTQFYYSPGAIPTEQWMKIQNCAVDRGAVGDDVATFAVYTN